MAGSDRGAATAVEVRPARHEDVALLERRMPPRMPGTHRERYAAQRRLDVVYLVAMLDSSPVGHVVLTWDNPRQARTPHLSDIAVHPAYQSRGIGTALMEKAELMIAERGYRRVGLAVALDNPRARALYERRGYIDAGLPVYCSAWPAIEEGLMCWHEEQCVYLVKNLSR